MLPADLDGLALLLLSATDAIFAESSLTHKPDTWVLVGQEVEKSGMCFSMQSAR